MIGLVFKKLWILSKLEKAAREIVLKPGLNLLTGENDVGKSTIIKSLYHAIGADVPQMDNTEWKRARPIYCANILLNDAEYYIVRDGKFFGVFDQNKTLLSRYKGIATENGIAHFMCKALNFRIELERFQGSQLGLAGPAFYYLPFYIDQDAGWGATWVSFDGLRQFKDYRKHMIEYHLGVRPQEFYDARKRELELKDELKGIEEERTALENVQKSYHQRKVVRQVDIDPSVFRAEVEQLVDQFNEIYSSQQEILHRLKEVRSERNGIDTDLQILRKAIAELDADYEYAEAPEIPDRISCPTCGTGIENSFAERFGILDDIDYCQSLADQRKKDRMEIQEQLSAIEEEYRSVSSRLKSVDELLRRKKEHVTFAELITSEGIKELLASISADIAEYREREAGLHGDIDDLAEHLKSDRNRKKEIVEFYQSRMKEYLNQLNVYVLEEKDYKKLDQIIKKNVLGSDLPRSLLAQYFAFLQTMAKFNRFVVCPMIIDSPQQQEQDPKNLDAIFQFILKNKLANQQLVIGTISVDSLSEGTIPTDTFHIELDEKYSVLQKDQYDAVLSEMGTLHEETLAEGVSG